MSNMDVDDSVLDSFLCTHEEDAEQFANFFTMLTSEDKKALIHRENDNCSMSIRKVDNKSESRNTSLSNFTQNTSSSFVENVCRDVHNENEEALTYDNNNSVQNSCFTEAEHVTDEMEAVELTQEYGNEVYTGGLANCISCNAIDIIPRYDNFFYSDVEVKEECVNNNSCIQFSLQEHIPHASEAVNKSRTNEKLNYSAHCEEWGASTEDESTALLLETISESCDCVNSNDAREISNKISKDDSDDNNKCLQEIQRNTLKSTDTKSANKHIVISHEEEINEAQSDQECCSLNSSITLPGIDNNEQELFKANSKVSNKCQDGGSAGDDKITKICMECQTTGKVTSTKKLTSNELAKLKSIVQENDDCVHAFYTGDERRYDAVTEKKDDRYSFNDALGNTLRHHTFIERV